jgi:hypothetical protein
MLLIITLSGDPAVDLIIEKLVLPVFRLNVDRPHDYQLTITPGDWEIASSGGHRISSATGSRCLWWKPLISRNSLDPLISGEIRASIQELYSWFARRSKLVGNSPLLERRLGKILQAEIASEFFMVPESIVTWGVPPKSVLGADQRWVAKSQAMEMTADGRGLFVTEVDRERLDSAGPWYFQPLFNSTQDVTIQVVGNDLFAFARSRLHNSTPDWRYDFFATETRWELAPVSPLEAEKVRQLCVAFGVNWGRFDFLRVSDQLVFLEINPNGQWGFLDPTDEHGLVSSIADFVSNSDTHGRH